MLLDPKTQSFASQRKESQEAARALGIEVVFLTAETETEIDAAFAAIVEQQIRALLVGGSPADALQNSLDGALRCAALSQNDRSMPLNVLGPLAQDVVI